MTTKLSIEKHLHQAYSLKLREKQNYPRDRLMLIQEELEKIFLAQRDSIIYSMGFNFDENYIKETSKCDMSGVYANNQTKFTPLQELCNSLARQETEVFTNAINKPLDDIDAMTASDELVKDLQEQFLKILESSNSYEDATNKLINQVIKQDRLESIMQQTLTNVRLKGFVNV